MYYLQADVIFLMTCSIREGAEKKIWGRIDSLQGLKQVRVKGQHPVKIGILGRYTFLLLELSSFLSEIVCRQLHLLAIPVTGQPYIGGTF